MSPAGLADFRLEELRRPPSVRFYPLADLRENAEQLDPLEEWCCILSEALQHFLHGRQLQPPLHLNPA
jgi:hypothetical protein